MLSKFDEFQKSAFDDRLQERFSRNIENVLDEMSKKSRLTKVDRKVLYGVVTHNPD